MVNTSPLVITAKVIIYLTIEKAMAAILRGLKCE
jgi:hypothetical protein